MYYVPDGTERCGFYEYVRLLILLQGRSKDLPIKLLPPRWEKSKRIYGIIN